MKKVLIAVAFLLLTGWGVNQFILSGSSNEGEADVNQTQDSPLPSNGSGTEQPTVESIPEQLLEMAEANTVFQWSVEIEKRNSQRTLYNVNCDADFRSRYDLDTTNQQHQPWSGGNMMWQWKYKEWVENFYSGRGVVGSGWTASAKKIVDENPDRKTLHYINVLGRIIASEWSKSNETRRINNSNLMSWNSLTKPESLPELAKAVFEQLK